MNKRMRAIIFVLLLMFGSALGINAQDNHFVYFQTENNQPFYLRMDGKLHSSTASGYLILPRMQSGTYSVFIGFPRNEFAEEGFQFDLGDKNDGYFILPSSSGTDVQNIETKKWLSKISAASQDQQQSTAQNVADQVNKAQEKDGFSELLGTVVNDNSIGSEPTAQPKKDEVAAEQPQRPAAPGATPIDTPGDGVIISGKDQDQDSRPVFTNTASVKLLSDISDEGEEMVYLDKKTNDTVRLLVPHIVDDIKSVPSAEKQPDVVPQGQDVSSSDKEVEESKKEEIVEKTPDPEVEKPIEKEVVAKEEKEEKKPAVDEEDALHKSACTTPADKDDFLKLRKAIAGESDMDVMIEIVTKAYNDKCFTTEQTKNLTYLFLTDEGRYRFLDATYDLVSDPENFESLVSTLEDNYYIRRFKAMIR